MIVVNNAGSLRKETTENIAQLQRQLLDWYDAYGRKLPWRTDTDPYKIWVSEIMLQQTRVETVIPYYLRFLRELPSVDHLARVSDEVLLKLWEGLGYYRRAANMKRAAGQLLAQHAGRLPGEVSELLRLPGIGPYTAGAIASIAFGQPVPAADGNVLRILARLTGRRDCIDDAAVRKELTATLSSWIPSDRPGDFNQALMDLGATVCLPNGTPLCDKCPLQGFCRAHTEDLTEDIPQRSRKKPRKIQRKTVFVIAWKGKVALQKRQKGGLLQSLWEFPGAEGWLSEGDCRGTLDSWGIQAGPIGAMGRTKHLFTHIEWHMEGFRTEAVCVAEPDRWTWVTAEEMSSVYPMPAALRFYSEQL